MNEYQPRGQRVYAYQVTRKNASAAAREFGCEIDEEAKWIVVPTVEQVYRLLITHEGPVVGRERETNKVVVWAKKADFDALYEPVKKPGMRGTDR